MTTNNAVNNGLSSATGTGNFVGSSGPTITAPLIVTGLLDSNSNSMFLFSPSANAVNQITVSNAITGQNPSLSPTGSDTNIALTLNGKGNLGVLTKGTTAGNNATSGYVGEFITSNVPFASSITLTTSGTSYDLTSISLTAGDWDVWGNFFVFSSANSATSINGWINTVSVTSPDNSFLSKYAGSVFTVMAKPVPQMRLSLSSTTTVYISLNAGFTSTAPTACGNISARRVR